MDREPEHDFVPRGRARTAQLSLIALLILGLLTAIFVIQNTDDTQVRFLAWSVTMPLAGALMLATVLGGIIAFLIAFLRQRQFRRAIRKEHESHTPGTEERDR